MQSPMSRAALLASALFLYASTLIAAEPMTGAGSSAAYPIYKLWADQLKREGGFVLNYDPVGSSAGVERARARQADFGATDVALKSEQLAKDNLILFPTVITGAVPVINLPKMEKPLVLDGPTLARIFLGEIEHWDAPEIRALNPGLSLPAKPIVAVVRSDGSGTTYNFADYLAKVSPAWKQKMGVATNLKWPASFTSVKGSKGVAEAVKSTPGSISYVDYNYVLDYKLTGAAMKNADGAIVEAGPYTFREALAQSVWKQTGDFTQTLTNQTGKSSWPITMGTFIVMPRVSNNPERTIQVTRFFTEAFMRGDDLAKQANFVRLPSIIQGKAFRVISEIVDAKGVPIGINSLR